MHCPATRACTVLHDNKTGIQHGTLSWTASLRFSELLIMMTLYFSATRCPLCLRNLNRQLTFCASKTIIEKYSEDPNQKRVTFLVKKLYREGGHRQFHSLGGKKFTITKKPFLHPKVSCFYVLSKQNPFYFLQKVVSYKMT